MTDVTHAFCRKCNEVQPVTWRRFKQVVPALDCSSGRVFEGMEAACDICNYEVAKLGSIFTESYDDRRRA